MPSTALSRTNLIANLEAVTPALAINRLIPLLTHYWFTGSELLAYNDQIALQVPFPSEFRGAVPGKFLELLKVQYHGTDADEIKLSQVEQELVVKQGKRTNFRLAMLEPNFLFEMPDSRARALGASTLAKLVDAIKHCLISVGRDTSTIEQLGITLEPAGDSITLYSTDSATISRSNLKGGLTLDARAILPTRFCEQMIAVYERMTEEQRAQATFELGSKTQGESVQRYALFCTDGTKLFGRLLETRTPLNFGDTVDYYLPPNFSKEMLVKVPSELAAALERACIVCDAQRRLSHVVLEDGRLQLKSKSDTEEVTDVVLYQQENNGRAEIKLEPSLLRRADDYNKMLIHGPCVIMAKTVTVERQGRSPREEVRSIYLISCSSV